MASAKKKPEPSSHDIEDWIEAEKARDEGLARIEASNEEWMSRAMAMAPILVHAGEQVMGEDVRLRMMSAGFPPPTKPNAWGALMRNLVRGGYFTPTGGFSKPKSKASHACRKAVYVRTIK